jgi:sulfatase maturation enzyme AslB (radical SAM superfamily)
LILIIQKIDKMATCNTESKTFCILPWTSLETDSNGNVKICCKSTENLQTNNGKMHLVDATLQELWTSDHINQIRNSLNQGEYHPNCERCWKEESSGAESMRTIYNRTYMDWIQNDLTNPQMLDLKLGIKCNLACRICSLDSSDQWIEETLYFMDQSLVSNKRKYVDKIYRAFDKSNDLWTAIDNYLPNLKRLDFYGGEPWLIQEHWDILQKMVTLGYSKNCVLHYTTNGTVFKPKQVALLKEFKAVSIQLSIDGVGSRFEYQRYPGKWSVIEKNIEKFITLRQYGVKLSTCTTLSNLNIWYVEELLKYFYDKGIQVFFNYLHGPPEFNLTNLPHDVKVKIKQRLEVIDNRYTKNLDNITVNNIINFMMSKQGQDVYYKGFAKKLKQHDTYRNENFMEVFPEFVDILPNFSSLYK